MTLEQQTRTAEDRRRAGAPDVEPVPSSRFRGDVEGLRAVAIGLVLLYHAGVPLVSGGFVGVDVFFVISGFLITTQLARELDRSGRISLVRFYARRAKRLLPATAVVLVATALLTWWLLPDTRWADIGHDLVASALYVGNWHFADQAVDYLATHDASPVQHFWSLAVEEQFYLVWPLLILAAAGVARARGWRPRPTIAVGLALVVVPSLLWSVHETSSFPARAFFETTTRMWELGVGAGVALAAGALTRLPRGLAVALGWSGLGAIALAGVTVSSSTAWPGYAAALPVLGTAAVISAGFRVSDVGAAAVLSLRPMRWVGGISYSLYLWHWPLIVVATVRLDGISAWQGLAVALASVVPAWLTLHLVENPLRHSRAVSQSPRFSLSLGANFTLVGVAAGLVLLLAVPVADVGTSKAPGAAVLRDDPRGDPRGAAVDRVDSMTPIPSAAREDNARIERCETVQTSAEVKTCRFGDPQGSTTVAVIGDSKISQWMPALRPIARQSGWQVTSYLKYACSFSIGLQEVYTKLCREWVSRVLDRIEADPPDFVITTQGEPKGKDTDGRYTTGAMTRSLHEMWSRITALGTKIVVIANNPHPGMDVFECVAEHPEQLTDCTYDRRTTLAASSNPVQRAAAEGLDGVEIVDLFDAICPVSPCAPVIGNVLVYRAGSHVTATYIKTLTPRLAEALDRTRLRATYRPSG